MAKFLAKVMPADVGGLDGAIRFMLGNGLEVRAVMSDIPSDMQRALMFHGLAQKVGDAAAGFSKANDFSGAFGAMQQVVDNLVNGSWSTRGQGGGTSDLVAALMNLKGITLEQAQDAVGKMDEDSMKKVLAHPAIKAEILDIRAKRAANAAENASDLDELLGDM